MSRSVTIPTGVPPSTTGTEPTSADSISRAASTTESERRDRHRVGRHHVLHLLAHRASPPGRCPIRSPRRRNSHLAVSAEAAGRRPPPAGRARGRARGSRNELRPKQRGARRQRRSRAPATTPSPPVGRAGRRRRRSRPRRPDRRRRGTPAGRAASRSWSKYGAPASTIANDGANATAAARAAPATPETA